MMMMLMKLPKFPAVFHHAVVAKRVPARGVKRRFVNLSAYLARSRVVQVFARGHDRHCLCVCVCTKARVCSVGKIIQRNLSLSSLSSSFLVHFGPFFVQQSMRRDQNTAVVSSTKRRKNDIFLFTLLSLIISSSSSLSDIDRAYICDEDKA